MSKGKRNYRKKNTKREEKNVVEEQNVWRILTIAGCVVLFLCFFYFVTLYLTRESRTNNNSNQSNSTTTILQNEILVGRSFDMSDGEYYVLYYDTSDDEIASTYSEIVSTYNGLSDKLKLYTVDMNNILNKSYVSESGNSSPSSAEEVQINGPTLIKFNNHQVVDYIEGEEGIRNTLS